MDEKLYKKIKSIGAGNIVLALFQSYVVLQQEFC